MRKMFNTICLCIALLQAVCLSAQDTIQTDSTIPQVSDNSLLNDQLIYTPKDSAKQIIEDWYTKHAEGYYLELGEVASSVESYHPEASRESKYLLRIRHEGMVITLSFKKGVYNFEWTAQNFKKYLDYYIINHIAHDIPIEGWDIYPRTPSSSNRKGITFKNLENGKLGIGIDWETYTVLGYLQTKLCKFRMQITDTPTPEGCYVSVRKELPLHISLEAILPQK